MATSLWPFFELAIRTTTLELRYPDDELAIRLAALAAEGIHDPATMPFGRPWTDVDPADLPRNSVQHFWLRRADLSPEKWSLPFAVLRNGEVLGVQDAFATDFPRLRSAETGSWLGRRFQGTGVGTEMRAAVLHLIFVGLEAVEATSGAWDDNASSIAVTRALGYEENGDSLGVRRGERARVRRFRLLREHWAANRRDDITVLGLDDCLPWLGLAER